MYEKEICITIFALFMAIIAISLAQNAQETADINNVFAIVVNNTDLYPAQRTQGVTYWANESPIAVYILFHSLGVGAPQVFDSNFSINGTVVLDGDTRTSAGAGFHDHWSFYTIVPKGANYSITNSTNVFNIEWREYPVLSGKNGTLSVNQTFITNGSNFNASYVPYVGATTDVNLSTHNLNANMVTVTNVSNIGYMMADHNRNVVIFGSNQSNATNARLQVDNNSAHIGFNIGNTGNSAITVEKNSNGDGLLDIRGKNQMDGTDITENTMMYMNASGFTIKSDKGNITLTPQNRSVNFSGSAIRNASQVLIGTNDNNIPSTSATFRNMRIMNNNITSLGFAEFVSFASSPRALFLFRTGKGNETAPLPVVVGDFTGEILGGAWVGNTGEFANNAAMNFKVDSGTVSDTSLPGIITFETSPSGSTSRAERMSINNTGHVKLNIYSGTGEGFVCFTSAGVIFRKETACATDG